jgi:hypothetical protein
MTTFCRYPSGTVTVSSVLGATGANRSPRAPDALEGPPWPFPAAGAACADGAPATPAAPAPAAATVTTAAARIMERRLSAPAMTSPTYSLPLVFGTSWKQASPHRKRQVIADRPPGCEPDGVPINGRSLRTVFSP